jgi:alpha-glucosidase
LNFKGKKLPIFVMEQGIGRGAQPHSFLIDLFAKAGGSWWTSYASVPYYLSNNMYALVLENYHYSSFDFRHAHQTTIEAWTHVLKAVLFDADSPLQLIEKYTQFCGRMRPLPDWIHQGAILGIQGGTDKVRGIYSKLKDLKTPIAGLWLQDWEGQRVTDFGKQLWWNWELDQDRYFGWHDLKTELWENSGARLLTYINPFLVNLEVDSDVTSTSPSTSTSISISTGKSKSLLKPNAKRHLYAEAMNQGYLIQKQDGSPYLIQNTNFSAGLVDLSNPNARNWIKSVIQTELIDVAGSSGWMADFGEALPYDCKLFSGESAKEWHNRYPEEWAKVNIEAVREYNRHQHQQQIKQPSQSKNSQVPAFNPSDVVFFSRSGYTRSPSFSTLFWLGDQTVLWDQHDGLASTVTGLVSSGLSGYSFQHSDIGGYTTISHWIMNLHRSKELFLRWVELNAFTLIFRTHEGNIPEANHQFYSDAETIRFFDYFSRVFSYLQNYRKLLIHEAATNGYPVVRALFLHFPAVPYSWSEISNKQFMLGSELLIAPVLAAGVIEQDVYLPPTVTWVHLWTQQEYTTCSLSVASSSSSLSNSVRDSDDKCNNSIIHVKAPLGQPPVFYIKGSAVGELLTQKIGQKRISVQHKDKNVVDEL